jgi:predicted ferric reductase
VSQLWHYLSRSSGIVATVLLVAALVWGLFFSARATGERRRPNWWLDLHNYLGGLAFAFTVVHIVAVFADSGSGIGLVQIFIPMTASGWAWGITWGVIATYIFAAVVFTSWPRKRLSRRAWLVVHLLSIPATIMAAGHAWMVGSSRHGLWFKALVASLVGFTVYPGVLRVARLLETRAAKRERALVAR